MFENTFEERLSSWRDFRETLEDHPDPIQAVIDYYNQIPLTSVHTDPWNNSAWPGPWELISENQYCEFSRVLGQCYSLQLTDRFKGSKFEIHIITDNGLSVLYLLFVDNNVIGWDDKTYVNKDEIPDSYASQKVYVMPPLQ